MSSQILSTLIAFSLWWRASTADSRDGNKGRDAPVDNLSSSTDTPAQCALIATQTTGWISEASFLSALETAAPSCDLCCLYARPEIQYSSWSYVTPYPVTVGTVYTIVDPSNNRTAITTEFVTTGIEYLNTINNKTDTFDPSLWLSDGRFIGDPLSAPRTAMAVDGYNSTHTITYPTPFVGPPSTLEWTGRIPVTTNGTTTCLYNTAGVTSIPVPFVMETTMLEADKKTNPPYSKDPNGFFYVLMPGEGWYSPPEGPEALEQYPANTLVLSVMASCQSQDSVQAPVQFVNTVDALFEDGGVRTGSITDSETTSVTETPAAAGVPPEPTASNTALREAPTISPPAASPSAAPPSLPSGSAPSASPPSASPPPSTSNTPSPVQSTEPTVSVDVPPTDTTAIDDKSLAQIQSVGASTISAQSRQFTPSLSPEPIVPDRLSDSTVSADVSPMALTPVDDTSSAQIQSAGEPTMSAHSQKLTPSLSPEPTVPDEPSASFDAPSNPIDGVQSPAPQVTASTSRHEQILSPPSDTTSQSNPSPFGSSSVGTPGVIESGPGSSASLQDTPTQGTLKGTPSTPAAVDSSIVIQATESRESDQATSHQDSNQATTGIGGYVAAGLGDTVKPSTPTSTSLGSSSGLSSGSNTAPERTATVTVTVSPPAQYTGDAAQNLWYLSVNIYFGIASLLVVAWL